MIENSELIEHLTKLYLDDPCGTQGTALWKIVIATKCLKLFSTN